MSNKKIYYVYPENDFSKVKSTKHYLIAFWLEFYFGIIELTKVLERKMPQRIVTMTIPETEE